LTCLPTVLRTERAGQVLAVLSVIALGAGVVGLVTEQHRAFFLSVFVGAVVAGLWLVRYALVRRDRVLALGAGIVALGWGTEQGAALLAGTTWGSDLILIGLVCTTGVAAWHLLARSRSVDTIPWEGALIGLVVLAALALRLIGVGHGLPYIHEWDEPYVVTYVVGMMQRGDLDPQTFSYPSLYFYMLLPVVYLRYLVLHGAGHLASPWAIQLFHPHAPFSRLPPVLPYWWYINAPSFYLWSRVTTSVIATAAVYLTYRIGKAAWTPAVGLLAASLVALAPGFVYYADTVRVDVPMVCFLCAAVLGGLRILRGGTPSDYLVAGWFAGLAVSTKQSGGVVVAALVVAHLLNPMRRGVAVGPLVVMIAAAAAAFVAGTPRILTDSRYLVDVWTSEARAYGGVPTPHSLRLDAVQNLLYFVRATQGGEWYVTPHAGFGVIPVCAAVLGFGAAGIRSPRLALYFGSFVVPYFCVMASQGNFFLRSMIPLLPFVAVFAAAGAVWVWNRIAQIQPHQWRAALAGLGLVLLLGEPAARAVRLAAELRHESDSRTQALAWLRQHARPGEVVAFDADLRWYLPAVRRLPLDVVYAASDRGIAWYRARGVNLAVVGAADHVRGARIVAHIGRPGFLGTAGEEDDPGDDAPVISPGLEILDVSR
jgi:4-amino-4-deoxy-L-arabinose transferase-like glycosyltransferase